MPDHHDIDPTLKFHIDFINYDLRLGHLNEPLVNIRLDRPCGDDDCDRRHVHVITPEQLVDLTGHFLHRGVHLARDVISSYRPASDNPYAGLTDGDYTQPSAADDRTD